MLTKQQLADFKKQLLDLQKTLIADNVIGDDARAVVVLDQSSVGRLSRMDAMQGQAMAQENERRRHQKLEQIDIALSHIDNNVFGHCIECDEEIAIKRLEFDPTSSLCIECASLKEDHQIQ